MVRLRLMFLKAILETEACSETEAACPRRACNAVSYSTAGSMPPRSTDRIYFFCTNPSEQKLIANKAPFISRRAGSTSQVASLSDRFCKGGFGLVGNSGCNLLHIVDTAAHAFFDPSLSSRVALLQNQLCPQPEPRITVVCRYQVNALGYKKQAHRLERGRSFFVETLNSRRKPNSPQIRELRSLPKHFHLSQLFVALVPFFVHRIAGRHGTVVYEGHFPGCSGPAEAARLCWSRYSRVHASIHAVMQ